MQPVTAGATGLSVRADPAVSVCLRSLELLSCHPFHHGAMLLEALVLQPTGSFVEEADFLQRCMSFAQTEQAKDTAGDYAQSVRARLL